MAEYITKSQVRDIMAAHYPYATLREEHAMHHINEDIKALPAADVVSVVRCHECAVPHNRWTGCPKLGGLIPPDDFYCGFGRKDGADNG
jgi:hypothetical protein